MKNEQTKRTSKKVSVSCRDLFAHEATGGLTYEEWTAADDLTRLKHRLSYIAERAEALSQFPYTSESDFPANLLSRAKSLALTAREGLDAIEKNELILAIHHALQTGKKMGDINHLLLLWGHIQVKLKWRDANKRGGGKAKRKPWAEKLAKQLTHGGKQFPAAWKTIPKDENNPLYLDDNSEIAAYRSGEGEELVVVDTVTSKELETLKKESFKKRYFAPEKKRDSK